MQDYSLVQAEVDGILRRFFTARIGMRFLLQHHIESFRSANDVIVSFGVFAGHTCDLCDFVKQSCQEFGKICVKSDFILLHLMWLTSGR